MISVFDVIFRNVSIKDNGTFQSALGFSVAEEFSDFYGKDFLEYE